MMPRLNQFAMRRLEGAFKTGRILRYLIGAIFIIAVASGVIMRIVDPDDFPSLGLALWWAVTTVTTVGYGDVVPVQPAGRAVAAVLMVVGFASLSLLTGIVASVLVNNRRSRSRRLRKSASSTSTDGWPRSSGFSRHGRNRLASSHRGGGTVLMSPMNTRTEFGRADAEEAARHWVIFLLAGITSIVFGALILSIDWSVDSLATFVGILFIVQGASLAITPSLDGSGRLSNMGAGAIAAGAGIALIAWPDKGLRTVGVFVGIFVLSSGVLHVVGALSNRHVPNWWLMLVRRGDRDADRHLGDATPGSDDCASDHAHGRLGGRDRRLSGVDGLRAEKASRPHRRLAGDASELAARAQAAVRGVRYAIYRGAPFRRERRTRCPQEDQERRRSTPSRSHRLQRSRTART